MKLHALIPALILAVTSVAVGCGDDAPPPAPSKFDYALEVSVTDTQENPLPKVPVTVDDKIVGYTDADGKFTGSLSDFEGKSLKLGVVAPPGYHFPPDTDSVTEMTRSTNVNGQQSGVPIYLAAVAESLEKDYFIWVKAACDNGNCEGWPVLVDGEEKGKTNSLGYSHFSFTAQPRNDIELEIVAPKPFKPSNPKYNITLDADSTVYRVEQPFKDPTKPKHVVRHHSSRKKKGTKKKVDKAPDPDAFVDPTPKKKDGVINLF